MYDLYFWPTPNGYKVLLYCLEAGLDHRIVPVNIRQGDQFKPEFLAISPNNRMPAIVDHAPADGGAPLPVFESGAILLYLADKHERFIPADMRGRVTTLEWLFWQMGGLGPMSGQSSHFRNAAKEKIEYAIDRYRNEVNRLYGVLNKRLDGRDFIVGDDYTIADMACYPWVNPQNQAQNEDDFPNIKRWRAAIAERPATKQAYEAGKAVNPNHGQTMTDAERKILLGQTAAVVR
jgi:GSH-dependent disulfide-bond oxidoreductase